MNPRTLALLALLSVGGSAPSLAQDLHIHYDLQTQELRYEYQGKPLQKPKARRGGQVIFHVENYNNYLYEANVRANRQEIQVPPTEGMAPLEDLFNTVAPAGLESLLGREIAPAPRQPGSDEDSGLELFGEDFGEKELGGPTGELDEEQLRSRFQVLKGQLLGLENEISALRLEAVGEIQSGKVLEIALAEVQKLKVHPELKPAQIKRLTGEYLQKVFDAPSVEAVDLAKVFERIDSRKKLAQVLERMRDKQARYEGEFQHLRELVLLLEDTPNLSPSLQELRAEAANSLQHAEFVRSETEKDLEELQTLLPQLGRKQIEELVALRYEYEAIAANEFRKAFRSPAEGDELVFEVELKLKDSTLANSGAPRMLVQAPIRVPVGGGFKVNASLGISFARYFDRPQDYFVRDSILLGQDLDAFVPVVTSFVHFYAQGCGNVSFGGSVGLGFPVVGGEGGQSIAFFAGPSLILGRSSRVVLSAGLMGGRVQRLGQGYHLGDAFEGDSALIPKSARYELGAFLGLSYNLTNPTPRDAP